MSPTTVSALAILLVTVLKLLGVEVASESLTTTIETVVVIVGAVVIYIRRLTSKTQPPVDVLGVVK
jgi:uncharacterized membrane protein